jgi:hypothetical protein
MYVCILYIYIDEYSDREEDEAGVQELDESDDDDEEMSVEEESGEEDEEKTGEEEGLSGLEEDVASERHVLESSTHAVRGEEGCRNVPAGAQGGRKWGVQVEIPEHRRGTYIHIHIYTYTHVYMCICKPITCTYV